ncbi:MAG: head-tail connector protein [Alphaproteobacteria bacterium]|nr:head-tail connector protein [Alphaproteobacteria bacterium]
MTHFRHRGLVRVTPPTAEPLTLQETKEFLRIPHNDDDSRINDMIVTARSLAEQWLRRSLITQGWKVSFEDAITGTIRLPMGPVQSITSVVTTTVDGVPLTIPTTAYLLSVTQDAIVVDNIISGHRIDITYVAGYGSGSQLPKPIKLGMLQHIAAMLDSEMTLAPIPDSVLPFYTPFRELAL